MVVVEADTLDEACQKAIEHDDWEDAEQDYDGARATTITAIREVEDLGLSGFLYEPGAEWVEVPEHFATE